MSNYYLVGCGGIGGWLAHSLVKTLKKTDKLTFVDGDKLERKNLDRQLFTEAELDLFKADALRLQLEKGARCKIESRAEYLGADELFTFEDGDWVLAGVDNHAARARMISMCERSNATLISASNGFEDAEAFIYKPEWNGGPLDPKVYYPEVMTDHSNDPLKPPCTGEILESTPQLAIANMSAASYAMWLLWFWREKVEKITDPEARKFAPVHVTSSAGRVVCKTIKDKEADYEFSNNG